MSGTHYQTSAGSFATAPRKNDPDALAYAKRLLKDGVGYQNAARISGVVESDLRLISPVARVRHSEPTWLRSVTAPRVVIPAPVRAKRIKRIGGVSADVLSILRAVALQHDITVDDLIGPSHRRHIAWPRQQAMYQVRKQKTNLSLPEIGRMIGDRDHTTILHGIRAHAARMAWANILIALGTEAYQPDLFRIAA